MKMSILGDISISEFLEQYWQKKPLLIRGAFPGFQCPLEPDDLAGLSLEDESESRIIIENGPNHKWELLNGPFEESTFETLPEEDWTLLVQGVNQWAPELADLLESFKFIPNWRLDDIMASFAVKGGSVGPHYDQYDVFLLQAHGQRQWQVGPRCDDSTALREDTPLCILQQMDVQEEWTLNPGDMLYLPPKYAHNGRALNDCITLSIGFRAPSTADALQGVTDHLCAKLDQFDRYEDPWLESALETPALVTDQAATELQAHLLKLLSKENIKEWIAESMSENKYPELHEPLEDPLEWDEIQPFLTEDHTLVQNETSRWVYTLSDSEITCFINGTEYRSSLNSHTHNLLVTLANQRITELADILSYFEEEESKDILLDLINNNFLYFDEL